MAKDKFKQMKERGGGALTSFQDIVENAKTVAAIEQQAAMNQQQTPQQSPSNTTPPNVGDAQQFQEPLRFMRLPNPQIPITEYNLVTRYCESFSNITRQDFVEMAIIEKLHAEGLMPDDDFNARQSEIRNRPPRGHRKGTKNQTSK